jgi:Kef-type K+ transport system membrane component KefB
MAIPEGHSINFIMLLIFGGAAVLSTLAIFTRQSMLVAYIALGILLGPSCLKVIDNSSVIRHIGDVGILFLLFLLGLNLPPQKLMHMLKKVSWVGCVSSVIFVLVGFFIAYAFHYSFMESAIIGAAMMFSSTIIGIKLLPTTILHHQHTGEVMISILLLQDMIAILVLLVLRGMVLEGPIVVDVILLVLGFPLVLGLAYLFERYILMPLFSRFNRIKEYLFLVAIAWCLAMAQLGEALGISAEVGAFIAGVSLASNPISVYLSESLKPLRDFFLVMFFFSVGASFDLSYLRDVLWAALLLAWVLLLVKPIVYRILLARVNESKAVAWEVGNRLGQISEFALIIAYVGLDNALIGHKAVYLIEAAAIMSFIFSSYWVVLRYPTPLSLSDRLRRD